MVLQTAIQIKPKFLNTGLQGPASGLLPCHSNLASAKLSLLYFLQQAMITLTLDIFT